MNEATLGRLTLEGGDEVERALRELVTKSARVVLRFAPRDNVKALVLAGGYGRGEGGIRLHADGERPANNLDLILFTVGLGGAARSHLTARINEEMETLRRRSGMGIDLSVVDARRTERDQVRLLWYDVRHGHKLLAGDPGFLPGLARFTVDNIDPREMTDLIINRGALLVLNDLILAEGPLTPVRREAVLTHTAKAIIGYGDAFLLACNAYHWSYVKRRERMQGATVRASPEFKVLYETAMGFRFSGDPQAADHLIEEAESGRLKNALAIMHLQIERERFADRRMTFDGYVGRSLRQELEDIRSSIRKMARGTLTLVRGGFKLGRGSSYSLRLALQMSGEQGLVRALFPMILYGEGNAQDQSTAAPLLGLLEPRSKAKKMAWILMWGRVFDPNLVFTLRKLGLPQEAAV